MPRTIGEDVKNELTLRDQFSEGDPIVLYYRIPLSEERISYESAKYKRTEGKIEVRLSEARQIWGDKILTGFKEGSFRLKIGEERKIIASDPVSPNYDPQWRDHIKKYASDCLEELAAHAFDGVRVLSTQEEFTEKNS
jgi:hypothetical protein